MGSVERVSQQGFARIKNDLIEAARQSELQDGSVHKAGELRLADARMYEWR